MLICDSAGLLSCSINLQTCLLTYCSCWSMGFGIQLLQKMIRNQWETSISRTEKKIRGFHPEPVEHVPPMLSYLEVKVKSNICYSASYSSPETL